MEAVGMEYDRESKLYDIFNCFNEIKIPYDFKIDLIGTRKNADADPDKYSVEQVLHEIEESYTSLVQKKEWKNPSGQSERDQMISMMANYKARVNPKDAGKPKDKVTEEDGNKRKRFERDPLPFKDAPGKNGDTKEYKGKTFWYCDKGHGKHGPWVRHTPEKHEDAWKKGGKKQEDGTSGPAKDKKIPKKGDGKNVTFVNAATVEESNEDELKVEVDLDKLKKITPAQFSAMQAAAEAVPGNKPFQDMVEGYVSLANSIYKAT